MHKILLAVLLGLLAGTILLRGLGLRYFGVPLRNEAAAPAGGREARGAADTERLQALHDRRLEDLSKRFAASEHEFAELRAKVAAVPKVPREPSREEKIQLLGRLMVRLLRRGAARPTSITPEMQQMLADVMKLCKELHVDMTDSAAMFKNVEFAVGFFDGMLDEFGLSGDQVARAEWLASLQFRIQSLGNEPGKMRLQKVTSENLLDFFNRFGEGLFDKDPATARLMSVTGTGSSVSLSQVSRSEASESLLNDVAKVARLDDGKKSDLRPLAERWAEDYSAALGEATGSPGERFIAPLFVADQLSKSNSEALAQIRCGLQFRSRIIGLEAQTVEEMAARLDAESAARLKQFDKVYYFKRISE